MAASCGTDGWHIPGTLVAAKWPHVALRHDRKYLCGQGVSCVELCICRTENPRVGGSILSLATTPIRHLGRSPSHTPRRLMHSPGAFHRLHDVAYATELELGNFALVPLSCAPPLDPDRL